MKLSRTFISATNEHCELERWVPAPYLRKAVTITAMPAKAELSVCGLGFYRFFLDGTELTRGHLSPYISAPDDILDYDVYDLSSLLTEGEHVLGFQLGNGMQNCFGGYVWDFDRAAWRSAPKLAVCLTLTDKDGKETHIEADSTFRCAPSPILYDDIRQGEVYDARKELDGWSTVGFDDSAWTNAIPAECPRGKSVICAANPIICTGERTATEISPDITLTHARSSEVHVGYLYDFGINSAGIPHLRVKGEPGQRIVMIFGEHIRDDGRIALENIRFVRAEYDDLPLYIQRDDYICKGEGIEDWSPVFTYHGFRYCLVCGITPEQATPDLLTCRVMNTDLPERGGFTCSDETLNTLQRMVRNSTLANFYHFPTDCPHREKNGWTADAALSVEHTLLNLEPENNYYEWMRHIRASMDERGAIPGIIPTGGWGFAWGNGPAWDQILTTLPYQVLRYRGSRTIAEESLNELFRYVNYLTTRVDENHLIAIGLGDWCAPYGYRSPLIFTDSVISMDICEKTAFLHELCGRKAQADFCRTVAANFRRAVREHLIDFDTMTAIGTGTETPGSQTSQAMALFYGIFEEEEKSAAYRVLLRKLREQDNHLDTGVLGARVLFRVLSEFGDSDLAYEIMTKRDFPSYGQFVEKGYTALPEDFNCDDEKGISSRNHHFYGDISAWFISCIGGIVVNPTALDTTHADICPHFLTALDHVEAFHITPHGKIEVKWERDGAGGILLTLTYPEGMHGKLCFDRGWVCAKCGASETDAASGVYRLIRA